MSSTVAAIDNEGGNASLFTSLSINQIIVDDPLPVALEVIAIGGSAVGRSQDLSIALNYDGETSQDGAVVAENYWGDMSQQLYGWLNLFYLDWWGN